MEISRFAYNIKWMRFKLYNKDTVAGIKTTSITLFFVSPIVNHESLYGFEVSFNII